MLPMRGSSAAHDKAEDHKSERAFTREQKFGLSKEQKIALSKELPTRNVEERQHLLEQVLRRHALRVGLCVFQQIFVVLVVRAKHIRFHG